MFEFTLRRGMLAAAGVTVLAVLAAGIAYAETTGGGTPTGFDACAKSVTGQLRLDTGDGCSPGEQALRLGAPAHVDEWAWYQGPGGGIPIVNGVWPQVRDHETTVMTIPLETGRYLVSTQLIAINNTGQGIVVCQTGSHTLGISLLQGAVGNTAGMALQQTMQSQTVFVVPAPQEITVQCFNAPPNEPEGSPIINWIDVTATKIDSATFNGAPN